MREILTWVLLSFLTISILLVPYINFLYKIRFQRQRQKTVDIFEKRTPIFDKLHRHKVGTPVGGGLLVVAVVCFLSVVLILARLFFNLGITSIYPFEKEIFILLFTFLSFGLLGVYDDVRKTFGLVRQKFWGLRFRQKFVLQWILAFIIAWMLYFLLGIHIVNVRFFEVFDIGLLYIPFAAFVIVSFANALNITDGLDGLTSGLLLICLLAFLAISGKILDSTLSVFLGLWIGSLIAFLYFNVWPARIWLGDVGALSFGATLAVVGLLLGKVLALVVIGGIFVVEAASSLGQLLSKKFRGKKLIEVAPIHLYFQNKGWEESKVVVRFWLAGALLAIIGLWLALP
jgi:phospho-N-acetylmuramoyl-pentapeptide-transferase